MDFRKLAKKIWHFIWDDNSIWSWIVNVIIAFVLIKFIVYPGLGLALGTSHPIVAVVSGSMVHEKDFDSWWDENSAFYTRYKVSRDMFEDFPMRDGFNKGDIIILRNANNVSVGDVIVFRSSRPDPIIHRVISVKNGPKPVFTTKGDHNSQPIQEPGLDEYNVLSDSVIGKSFIRIPLIGYIKIWFVEIIQTFLDLFRRLGA